MSLHKPNQVRTASKRKYPKCREVRLHDFAVVFVSDGKQNKEIDTQISKTNSVLRELYRCVVTKRGLLEISLSFQDLNRSLSLSFASGHGSWMTERVPFQVQRWDFCEKFMGTYKSSRTK